MSHVRHHVHAGAQGNSKTDPTVTVSEAAPDGRADACERTGDSKQKCWSFSRADTSRISAKGEDPVEIITQRAQLDELANQPVELGKNWTAVVIDRQGGVFGTYLGDGKWIELGSAGPFCLSGRIALPARRVDTPMSGLSGSQVKDLIALFQRWNDDLLNSADTDTRQGIEASGEAAGYRAAIRAIRDESGAS